LDDVPRWDSRVLSLGAYCRSCWRMQWSTETEPRAPFEPDELHHTIPVKGPLRFSEFLTHQDWHELATRCSSGEQPTVTPYLLHRCHRLSDTGETRYALIEGCSALEIAVEDFVRRKCDGPLKQEVLSDKFNTMHAVGKMALITYMVPGIAHSDIEKAAEAIDL